jgi:hypothetical protein
MAGMGLTRNLIGALVGGLAGWGLTLLSRAYGST